MLSSITDITHGHLAKHYTILNKNTLGYFTFWLKTLAETFAEPKLRSKYLLKSKSEVVSLSKNMATNMDSLEN